MLHGGCDYAHLAFGTLGRRAYGGVVGLRRARGEDYLVRLGVDEPRNLFAGARNELRNKVLCLWWW